MDFVKEINFLANNASDLTENSLVCRICKSSCSSHHQLQAHFSSSHSEDLLCKTCTKYFADTEKLRLHEYKTHPRCDECEKVFDSPYLYLLHNQVFHLDMQRAIKKPVEFYGKTYWMCTMCSSVFDKQIYFAIHKLVKHP